MQIHHQFTQTENIYKLSWEFVEIYVIQYIVFIVYLGSLKTYYKIVK